MTFFFDNHHPQSALDRLRQDGHEVVHLREVFSDQGLDDEEWIPIIAERGWVLVTADHKILRRRAEKSTFRRSGLIAFFMAKEYNGKHSHVRVRWILGQWARIVEAARTAQPGDCFLVPEKGKLKAYPIVTRDDE